MAVQAQTFPLLNFQQANPGLQGAQAGMGLMQQGMQTAYLPQQLQQQLLQKQIANQLSQIQLQYAPQMTQADLAYKQAQTPNLQAQTQGQEITNQYLPQSLQSDIALKQAQALATPYTAMGTYYGGIGRMGMANYYNNPATALSRVLNSPSMQSLISTNPDVAKNVTNALSAVSTRAAQMGQQGQPGQPPQIPQLGQQQAQQNPLQQMGQSMQQGQQPQQASQGSQGYGLPTVQQLSNPYNPQQNNQLMTNGTDASVPSAPIDNNNLTTFDYNQMQQNNNDSLLKKTRTPQMINQSQYSAVLDNLLDEGAQLMPAVSKYTGISGMLKKVGDSVESALGHTSQDYSDYMNFTHITAPNTANEIRRVLGGQATDYEGRMMTNISNPSYWDSNPKQAMQQYKYLTNLYKNRVSPIITGSPSANLKNMQQNSSPSSQYSDTDLQYTAQKYGMTVDQVKQKLGAK